MKVRKGKKHSKIYFNSEEIDTLEKAVDLFGEIFWACDNIYWACDKGFVLICNGKPLFTKNELNKMMLKLYKMSKYAVKVVEGEE